MAPGPHPTSSVFPHHLVEQALEHARALPVQVPVLAISGLQGSGKSTLAVQVAALGQSRGLRVAVLSIDDFYLGRAQRQALAARVHPLLATRGPPGTHDVAEALDVLARLRGGGNVPLPRFDKLADERVPRDAWPSVQAVDLVVFEGWFLGTPAQDQADLAAPVNALERDEDAAGIWRHWCNEALGRDYPPLWAWFDALWFLQPPAFEVVPQWRWQQEQALRAASGRGDGMDRAQVERFVQLYERVSRHALRTLPGRASHTVRLDAQRRVLG